MAKQGIGNLGNQPMKSIDNTANIEPSQGEINIDEVTENVTAQLVENNGVEPVKSNSEADDIYRQEIIDEIKKTKDDNFSKSCIEKIFDEKLKGKEIPMKYRQQIVDEIGASRACSYVIFNPEHFEGTRIEKCVLNAVEGGELLEDYCIQLMTDWKPFDYIQLLDGVLAIKLSTDQEQDNKSKNSDWKMEHFLRCYLGYMWKELKGVTEDVEWDGDNAESVKDKYKKIPDKILESDYYIFLPDLLENSNIQHNLKPTKEFYEKLVDKIIEYYKSLDDNDDKKNIERYLKFKKIKDKAGENFTEPVWEKIEKYLYDEQRFLDADPSKFLQNLDKFPGKLLDDKKVLQMLDEKLLSPGYTDLNYYDVQFLDRLIPVDPNVFDRYADRLIETGDFNEILVESTTFGLNIDLPDKIKKAIEHEKDKHGLEKVCNYIYHGHKGLIDREEIAKLFEKEGKDINNYPKFFPRVLDNRALLAEFDSYEKYHGGYKVTIKGQNGSIEYGFLKDGEIKFKCNSDDNFDDEYGLRKYKNASFKDHEQILEEEGHITKLGLQSNDNTHAEGARVVVLPNGEYGTAVSWDTYDKDRNKNVKILDENGNFLFFIKGPEGAESTKLTSDKDTLYVCTCGKETSYLTAYGMGQFNVKWRLPLEDSDIKDIDINNNELIIYDRKNEKIKYIDKINGNQIEGKETDIGIDTNYNGNLAAFYKINEMPGLKNSIYYRMQDDSIELQKWEFKNYDFLTAMCHCVEHIAIDTKEKRVFLTMKTSAGGGEDILIFNEDGFEGRIPRCHGLQHLDFDEQTNSLLVSEFRHVYKYDYAALNTLITSRDGLEIQYYRRPEERIGRLRG